MRAVAIPLARGYLRYAPFSAGKRYLWERVVRPRLAWVPYEFRARTLWGARLRGNTQDLVQRYIYYFGVWEPHITGWIRRTLGDDDVFVDVGANIGYYSILASRLVGKTGRVVAIEASPRIFRALFDNLEANGSRNVRALNVAAADAEGTLAVYLGGEKNLGETTTVKELAPDLVLEAEVRAAPLSGLLEVEEVRKARLIKIDVEGAEWSVACGLQPLLHSLPVEAEIVIEVNPAHLRKQGTSPAELTRLFTDAGYHAYSIRNEYVTAEYLTPPALEPPHRLEAEPTRQIDIVFSRRDSTFL